MQTKRKIAVIGAGSIGFTRCLMHDILSIPELQETEFAFMDISGANLDMMAQIARRDIEANGLPANRRARVWPTVKPKEPECSCGTRKARHAMEIARHEINRFFPR